MGIAKELLEIINEWAREAHGGRKTVHTSSSSSSPGKVYNTIEYQDGTMSCDCPGWTHARGGQRHCKHIAKFGGKSIAA